MTATDELETTLEPGGLTCASPVPSAGMNRTQNAEVRRPCRIIQLDFVRGIAILSVMEYHFRTVPISWTWLSGGEHFLKRVGWMGVDLFFVLSGFLVGGLLISELLAKHDIHVRRFLLRRMLKIWPAYYSYILFQICARKHPLPSFAWQNVLNIQNYAGTTLKQTWSLAVEEHFYLALPLLLILLYKSPRLKPKLGLTLFALCIAVLVGRIVAVYGFQSGDPQWKTHARIDSLLFGVILSYLFYTKRELFDFVIRQRVALVLFSVVGPVLAFHDGHGTRLMWSFGYSVTYFSAGAIFLLCYGYRGKLTGSAVYRAVAWVGLYSYGIYLWHLSVGDPIVKFASHLPVSTRWGVLFVGQYLAAILVGVLLTKAVELPMLKLRDRIIPRNAPEAVSSSLRYSPSHEAARSEAYDAT